MQSRESSWGKEESTGQGQRKEKPVPVGLHKGKMHGFYYNCDGKFGTLTKSLTLSGPQTDPEGLPHKAVLRIKHKERK